MGFQHTSTSDEGMLGNYGAMTPIAALIEPAPPHCDGEGEIARRGIDVGQQMICDPREGFNPARGHAGSIRV